MLLPSPDIAFYLKRAAPAPDVAAEHARLDRADALVLVFPIYWWSFPALLKGWIDRVFTLGWAFDESAEGKIVKKLQHLDVHMLAIGGADERTYARHGYFGAMKTQINHGIFDFCGAPVRTSRAFRNRTGTQRARLVRGCLPQEHLLIAQPADSSYSCCVVVTGRSAQLRPCLRADDAPAS